jgi:hypothetical protein
MAHAILTPAQKKLIWSTVCYCYSYCLPLFGPLLMSEHTFRVVCPPPLTLNADLIESWYFHQCIALSVANYRHLFFMKRLNTKGKCVFAFYFQREHISY